MAHTILAADSQMNSAGIARNEGTSKKACKAKSNPADAHSESLYSEEWRKWKLKKKSGEKWHHWIQRPRLPLMVVHGTGPWLLGWNCLAKIPIDWSYIKSMLCNSIGTVMQQRLEYLMAKHTEINVRTDSVRSCAVTANSSSLHDFLAFNANA